MSALLISRLTLRSTARAMPWSPVVVVATSGLAMSWAAGALSARTSPLPVAVAGALASAAVATLRDPADELLRALPTGIIARRLLRAVLVTLVVAPATVGVAMLTPGPGAVAATVALGLTGLAAAMWLPVTRVLAAAAVPVCWVLASLALDDRLGVLGDIAAWWWTRPWLVAALAATGVATAVARRTDR